MRRKQAAEIPAEQNDRGRFIRPENPAIRARIDALKSYVSEMSRGDLVTLDEIEAITGLERRCDGWSYIIDKWSREMMAERGIEMVNVFGEGYQLSPVQYQIIDRPQQRFKRAVRQINRGIRSLYRVQDADLSDHQRMVRAKFLAANKEAKRGIRAQMAASASFAVVETNHSARLAAAKAIARRNADAGGGEKRAVV